MMSATSDRIRMGFIGVGNRGSQLLQRFAAEPDVDIVALCDVYEPYLRRDLASVHPRFLESGIPVPPMGEPFAETADTYTDFRRVLARKDVDAVCIATPDHWHAVQTVMAFEAGKDVFVEKPLTIAVQEGRRMVQSAQATGRIGAVGLNRRGSSVFRKLAHLGAAGLIGKVTMAHACHISDMYPDGIGRLGPEEPPGDLDWDKWLGPRPRVPYRYNMAPYRFRWWRDYSSQMGNWGVHYLDAIRWLIGERAPVAVCAVGSNCAVNDDRTIPDTMQATFEFASGTIARFEIVEGAGGQGVNGGEIEFRGTKGMLITNQNGYRIVPARPGQFQRWESLIEPREEAVGGTQRYGDLGIKEDSTAILVRDFLDCVKTRRRPLCSLEDGHRSTCFAHLANISLQVGQRLGWDPEAERFTNCDAANELLHYEYRGPWKL